MTLSILAAAIAVSNCATLVEHYSHVAASRFSFGSLLLGLLLEFRDHFLPVIARIRDRRDILEGGRAGSAKQRRLAKQEKDQKWVGNLAADYTTDTFEVERSVPCKYWGRY